MLWWIGSAIFFGLAIRAIRAERKDKGVPQPETKFSTPIAGVVGLLCFVGALLTIPPLRGLWLEHRLHELAVELSETKKTSVHCNTFFDSLVDPNYGAAGHANIETGDIVVQPPGCEHLQGYLSDPEAADEREVGSVLLFAHEAMHVRGERNEAKTQCQAVQRFYRAARAFGAEHDVAETQALWIFEDYYPRFGQFTGKIGTYFSHECRPGGKLDEKLPDSHWQ